MRISISSRTPSPAPNSNNRAGDVAFVPRTAILAKLWARPMSTALSRLRAKPAPLQMVHAIEAALQFRHPEPQLDVPATKQQAIVKLKGIEDKIGYPSHWRDYSSVKIVRDSYLNNVAQATSFEFERWVAKIGKPVDRAEWTMTPPTINAYYDPQLNTINFPAGILQPPFFDPTKDDAVNYGAIGMVIGHEIIHGFDDQGRKFDAQGNLRDWWTAEDAQAIRRARQVHLRRVHPGRSRRRPRSQAERSAHPGRRYRRQRRHPSGTKRARGLAEAARQDRSTTKAPTAGPTASASSFERVLVVRERAPARSRA